MSYRPHPRPLPLHRLYDPVTDLPPDHLARLVEATIEAVWLALFAVAARRGLQRLGHLVVDSSKFRANASDEAVLTAAEYEAMRAELQRVLAEAEAVDAQEAATGR